MSLVRQIARLASMAHVAGMFHNLTREMNSVAGKMNIVAGETKSSAGEYRDTRAPSF